MTTYTREELLALADIDPELQKALDNRPWTIRFQSTLVNFLFPYPSARSYLIPRIRAHLATRWSNIIPDPSLAETEELFTTRDGTSLRARIYRPATTDHPGPLILLFHGGGWVIGNPENNATLAHRFVTTYAATVVCPAYRLAPEHPFPTGIDDTYDAVRWAAANAESLGADIARGFIVGGQSAGAIAAAVACLRARDDALAPPITGAYVSAPSLLPAQRVPDSLKDRYLARTQAACVNDEMSPAVMRQMFREETRSDPMDGRVAAYCWPTGHESLPKTYMQVCGRDVSRDDGLLYEELLRGQGVATRLDVYKGLSHVWWAALPELEASRRWMEDTINGFAWLLGVEAPAKA